MSLPVRLLGFAFTNADFLFEMDTEGKILFAAGAANDLVKENGDALVGKPAGKLFKPSEGIKFATFSKALKAGDRAGPFKLMLATGAEANLAMFKLPQNGSNISCSLARPGTPAVTLPPGRCHSGVWTRLRNRRCSSPSMFRMLRVTLSHSGPEVIPWADR